MKRSLPQFFLTALALTVAVAACPARADDDSERESLARITYEIQRLQQMVAEASKEAPSSPRVRFRYDWLQRDLDAMRQGIEAHTDAPRQPRTVTPLRGDYRQ